MMQPAGLWCVGDPGLASSDQFSPVTSDVRMKTLDVRDSATERRRIKLDIWADDHILSVSVQSLASQLTLLQFAQISDVWQFTNGSIVDHATNF